MLCMQRQLLGDGTQLRTLAQAIKGGPGGTHKATLDGLVLSEGQVKSMAGPNEAIKSQAGPADTTADGNKVCGV
jgi:hypothetical protein